jgi:[acyl-carrier-protein] S-malonyltransferase
MMQSRLALLCPGQGGQHRGMFDLARMDGQAGMLLDQWLSEAQLGTPLDTILSDDALLFSNLMAQPLIVAATLAAWEAIKSEISGPALVAGYSIGELAAYGVAGALASADAVALASSRAQLMDACLKSMPSQGLIAVSGLPTRIASDLLRTYEFHMAIETGEDSFIAGGPAGLLGEVEKKILASGGRTNVLPVEVASHTPFMRPAVVPFAQELRHHRFIDPHIPVLSGISAEMIHQSEKAILHLSRQIAETIMWKDCMDACAESGVTVALELGPGASLSRMLHARHPQIECRSVADFRSLDGIKKWLIRHVN